MPETNESYWRGRARELALGVNVGWWFDRFLRIAVPAAALGACAILFLRTQDRLSGAGQTTWISIGVISAIAALGAWFWARGKFVSPGDALVRLEKQGGLRNALSAADAGVSPWPSPDDDAKGGYRAEPLRSAGPLVLATTCLIAAFLIPISVAEVIAEPEAEPMAWAEMEEWAVLLEEEEVISEEEAEDIREEVEGLREKSPDDWFSHHSLEASDTMRSNLDRSIQELGKGLEAAERTLGELAQANSEEGRDALSEEFANAMQEIMGSPLEISPELAEALSQIDPSQLQGLDPDLMEELRERLREASGN